MYKGNRGYRFEVIAQKYLINKGYKIIEANYMCRFGEIDIIATKDNYLCFIEVKARKNTDFGMPCEYVTPAKIRKIISTAKYYLYKNRIENSYCRFDVIEVVLDSNIINHIENAFCEG